MGLLRLEDCECPWSIWVERRGDSGWRWELIDQEGRAEQAGLADGDAAAFVEARGAARRMAQAIASSAVIDRPVWEPPAARQAR